MLLPVSIMTDYLTGGVPTYKFAAYTPKSELPYMITVWIGSYYYPEQLVKSNKNKFIII